MTPARQYTARATAMNVLNNARHGDASDLLGALLETTDRGDQATDLVYGVLRNTTLLDTLLSKTAGLDRRNVKPTTWNILRLGAYELVYAPKTADYAIIHEAVHLARRGGSQKNAGFVNAVLRSVQRGIVRRDVADVAQPYDPRAMIVRADGGGCLLSTAILPDPAGSPDDFLHTLWSLPLSLVRQWIAVYGQADAARICCASNRHPSVYAWPTLCRISAEALAERLTAEGVGCRLWPQRGAIQLEHTGPISRLESFRQGLFYVQDPTAEAIGRFLDPQPGWTIADLCAAPGGKSIALALKMRDKGTILASDISDVRLERLTENIARLSLSSIQSIAPAGVSRAIQQSPRLDALILDVPCSNTGVLARRVEARGRLDRPLSPSLLKRQQALLNSAKSLLREGTKLVYSTCSIQPEENQHQIQRFLRQHSGLSLVKQQTTLPSIDKPDSLDYDGGYMALLCAS